jgi:radical SAM superfamily enzyme YgiQ (UPF0313 family)
MESADPVVLRNMRKGTNAKVMDEFAYLVRYMRKLNMIANINIIVGFPGEDAKSVRRTIDFLLKAKPMAYSMSKFFLERGTDIWNRRKEFGLYGLMYGWKHKTMTSSDLDALIRYIFVSVSADSDICHWTSASVDLIRHMAKGKRLEEIICYMKAVNRICAEDIDRKNHRYTRAYHSDFRFISAYLA